MVQVGLDLLRGQFARVFQAMESDKLANPGQIRSFSFNAEMAATSHQVELVYKAGM